MKLCLKCKEEKEESLFPKSKSTKDGLYCYCKTCHSSLQKKRYEENKQDILDYHRDYYQTNKTKKQEYDKKYYAKNKDRKHKNNKRWNDKNRQYLKDWISNWKKENSEKVVEYSNKRRAVKLMAMPGWLTEEQLEEISYIYLKAKDMKEITGEEYHVDHVIPLQGKNVCGLHVPWNLQILPAKENLRKGNKVE